MRPRPLFAFMLATYLAQLAVLGLALGPYPAWWGLYAPSAAAAFSLREVRYLVRYDECAWGALQDWRQLYQDPEGRLWFRALARDAIEPAALTYALAGLYGLDRPAFDSVLRAAKPHLLIAPLPVYDGLDQIPWLSVQAVMPDLRSGRLTAIYEDPTPRPYC